MNGQQSLFNVPPHPAPAAFESDTSREAAVKVRSGKHASIQARVLAVLKNHNHGMGMTDEEIAEPIMRDTGCRFTSVVSARNSLCKRKWTTYYEPALVINSGNRRLSPTSGMRVVVWRCTK